MPDFNDKKVLIQRCVRYRMLIPILGYTLLTEAGLTSGYSIALILNAYQKHKCL